MGHRAVAQTRYGIFIADQEGYGGAETLAKEPRDSSHCPPSPTVRASSMNWVMNG